VSAAFTPGPWQAIKGVEASDDMRCGVSAMRGAVGYLVATIENGAPGDICDTEFANARLIAAAPELHTAAQLWADYDALLRGYAGPQSILFDGDLPEVDAAYDRARDATFAALAKARSDQ
jgi:hypothetical protein